jgi:hypothetical protein
MRLKYPGERHTLSAQAALLLFVVLPLALAGAALILIKVR